MGARLWLVVGFAMLGMAGVAFAGGLLSEAVLQPLPPDRRNEVREIVADSTFVRALDLEAVADLHVFAYLLDHRARGSSGRSWSVGSHPVGGSAISKATWWPRSHSPWRAIGSAGR